MRTKQDVYDFLADDELENLLPVYQYAVDRDSVTFSFYTYTDCNLTASNMQAIDARLSGLDGCEATGLGELTIYGLDDGKVTPAMRELATIVSELRDNCVLDDIDYEEREHSEAADCCMDAYGEQYFAKWRAGELAPEVHEVHLEPEAYPRPEAYPELTDYDLMPGSGPVHDWIFAHAYAAYRDYI